MPVRINSHAGENLFSSVWDRVRKTNELFVGLEYLHFVPYGRDTDQPVVAGTHRTVIHIDAIFVLRLVVIAFDRACLADGGAGRDKQILVIVTTLLEKYGFLAADRMQA